MVLLVSGVEPRVRAPSETKIFRLSYMKLSMSRKLNILLAALIVVLVWTNLSTYSDLRKYREIGKELTGEEKSADYFYRKYEENHKLYNNEVENEYALVYLGIAAHMGYDEAQASLGLYISDRDTLGESSGEVGLRWRKKAALQGKPQLQYSYAFNSAFPIEPWEHLTTEETAQREMALREAFDLYKKSAEQGYYSAMRQTARWYRKGIGCEKNLEEALRWAKRAYDYVESQREGGEERDALLVGEIYMDMERPDLALPYLELAAIYGVRNSEPLWQKAKNMLEKRGKEQNQE